MRRFVTVRDIEHLVDEGIQALDVDRLTTVTDAARERALERGVRLVPVASDADAGDHAPADTGLAERVRQEVVLQLGAPPPADLDAVIARVLARDR
jgi:hypothetical protein